jgi:hypothetical protein
MVGEPQGAMRVTSQIWKIVFASQTLPVFCFSLHKKAQYVIVIPRKKCNEQDALPMVFGVLITKQLFFG